MQNNQQTEFVIRAAAESDIPEIMQIMNAKPSGNTKPEWYITDEEDAVRDCLGEKGFILVSQTEFGEIAGFFIARYPSEEENLGTCLGFSTEQFEKVILMDSAAIKPEFRGNGLQGKMLVEVEKRIDTGKYHYSMCTVHPDNKYSLHNMQKHGYEIQKTITYHGDYVRYLLLKELS